MRVFLSAWESSSDRHGASLLRALKQAHPDLEAFGVGGPAMRAEGLRCIVDLNAGQVMGFGAVIRKLPRILRSYATVRRALDETRPDVAVLIDYPGLHLRLARFLYRRRIPTFDFIPPKIWVWGKRRHKSLNKYFRSLLCIFPFEVPMYRGLGCDHATYVGNPLIEHLPMGMTREQARAELGLTPEQICIAMMPGSRPSEIQWHLKLFLDALFMAQAQMQEGPSSPPFVVNIPVADAESGRIVQAGVDQWQKSNKGLNVRVTTAHAGVILAASDAGLIKSGTSTLEAALMRCPHVVVYAFSKVSLLFVRIWVRYSGAAALSNILWQKSTHTLEKVFPEHLGPGLRPEYLAKDLLRVLRSPELRKKQLMVCNAIRTQLVQAERPGQLAAKIILETYLTPRERARSGNVWAKAWASRAVSHLWTLGHRGRVALHRLFGRRPAELPGRVLGIGNVQAGGAGKTPLVMHLAREAHGRGKTVAILTRGYGGRWERTGGVIPPQGVSSSARTIDPELCGDEAALIAFSCPFAWIGVGKDRLSSYRAIGRLRGNANPIDVVLLDDAAQNLQIRKHLDVMALTSASPSTQLFRQTARRKTDKTLNIWTKGGIEPDRFGPIDVRVELSVEALANRKYWLVTSVGDPGSVLDSLERAGLRPELSIVKRTEWRDHRWPNRGDIDWHLREAQRLNLALLMTGKDWIKWSQFEGLSESRERGDVVVIEPELKFLSGRERWEAMCWES